MLEFLRRGVRSWVVKVLLGLLVASFAVWGIGDIGAGFSTRVATVGEREVPASLYATTLRQQQQQFGLDPTQIRAVGLDTFVLGQMVREAALDETVSRLGVSAPDAAVARDVRANSAFRLGGEFDPVQYESAVTRVFASVAAFENTVRDDIASRQLVIATTGGTLAPEAAVTAIDRHRQQRRVFDVVLFPLDDANVDDPTEEELAAHLAANEAAFERPEQRAVTWLHIDPDAIAADIEVEEDELRAEFEARRASLETPETREVSQTIFNDMAAAEAARARIESGEIDFDDLVSERGLDPMAARLGELTADDLPGARGEAAFALEAPGVAGPVRTAGGAALLDIRSITPGRSIPFAEVADVLRAELARERAQPVADSLAEEVEDLSAGGATIPEIARELGLPLGQIDNLDATGGVAEPGTLPASPAFLSEAFAASEGEERRLQAGPDGGYFLLQVTGITPPTVPPLDEIREDVAGSWRADRAAAEARAAAQRMAEALAAGNSLETLASEANLTVTTVGPLRRGDPDPRLTSSLRQSLFSGRPGATGIGPAVGGVALAVLRDIIDPPAESDGAQELQATLGQSLARDQLEYLGRALEAQAGVSVNRQTIDSVLTQIGG
jgi:peptidyl-prolyl cis-trans isomerase D